MVDLYSLLIKMSSILMAYRLSQMRKADKEEQKKRKKAKMEKQFMSSSKSTSRSEKTTPTQKTTHISSRKERVEVTVVTNR